jgi:hypothetical protein
MMGIRCAIAIAFILRAAPSFACSCHNGIPIQKTSERYRNKAVFTAHIVQLVGRKYNWDGKQYSSMALAVVKERYWGLPWYWPKVVLLDGSYPCDIAMTPDEDYLVSGLIARYGVLEVNACSRTQPLKTAQVDLRTLDGSHCGAPGGTIVGRVSSGKTNSREHPPAPNVTVTLRDWSGKTYTTQSDGDGIYEMRHLPPGFYYAESFVDDKPYALSRGGLSVSEGLCFEMPIRGNYVLRGGNPASPRP